MERGDRSIKALKELLYIDSLEDELRASGLESWVNTYIIDGDENSLYSNLSQEERLQLSELYYKNINFLKSHRKYIRETMDSLKKQRKFFQ